MGEHFQAIVDVEATEDEAEALADAAVAWLVETGVVTPEAVYRNESSTVGLEVFTRRTVFYSMTGYLELSCPSCGWSAEPEGIEDFNEVLGGWVDGGPGELTCVGCAGKAHLNDWRWSEPWGFGCLGFQFWGWPTFSPEFLDEFAARLGHRTVHPYGKL